MSDRIESRRATVEAAVAEWKRRLVSLDGRNRMLYFRELTRGTLEMSASLDGVSEDHVARLLAGDEVRLSDIYARSLLVDAAEKVRAISAKARSNFEEKGLGTLYVGHSFASWTRDDGHTPRAPVVLIPVRIELASPGGDDALLQMRAPAEVNPSFEYAALQDLGISPYPDAESRTNEYLSWLDHVSAACATLPDFGLDDRMFLANLEFTKLPIVVDMDAHVDVLIGNDIVAAMAGFSAAQNALNVTIDIPLDRPDRTPPADEYLVCDADANQHNAVFAALEGTSLVIHGPPGTGKSQTIANLISSLGAVGKSVLFVAEKRAAIAAVTRRLDEAGCEGLVLDLHDGSSRRHVAEMLQESLDALASSSGARPAMPPDALVNTRKILVAHERQLHRQREPHGLSFFELQAMLGTPDGEKTGVRLSTEALEKWTPQGRSAALALLAAWRGIAERLADDPTGMWSTSAIRSGDAAEDAKALVDRLVTDEIPAVQSKFGEVLSELELPDDLDVPIETFADVIATLSENSSKFGPHFLDQADRIAAVLGPAGQSLLSRLRKWILSSAYRRTLGDLSEIGQGMEPDVVQAAAWRVAEARRTWSNWFPGIPVPRPTASFPELASVLAPYKEALAQLTELVPAIAGVEHIREQETLLWSMHVHRHLADARADLARADASLRGYGLGPLLQAGSRSGRHGEELAWLATRVFAISAIDAITWQEPELATFSGQIHDRAASQFAELDARHIGSSAGRVLRLVNERANKALADHPREAALVRHEANLKIHHMPIRQLIARAPNVVRALRPCWAMSPLLVPQLLPATHEMFDVVIFDEASQILPVDAIPAIARGAQLVVAGDPQQLPPREFRASDSSADQVEANRTPQARSDSAEFESVLDVMRDLLPERKLNWHYRSQDERLINFSNMHTYDRSLVTFPGTKQGTGIQQVLVESVPETDAGTASNPDVARRVAALVLEHAKAHPEESLGVIATGLRHAQDITEALRQAVKDDPNDFGGFFDDLGAEPFFIKIMDTVQGDERDHIIFSVGYGRNPAGEVVYRWGVLNRKGGERRLNVAVTRAKQRMTVVTSVAAADIDPTRTRSRGAALLAEYLEYSERGGLAIPGTDGQGPLTPFEMSVRDRLSAAGIPLSPRHGGGRHRIDFAAFASVRKVRPVLAIETDGLGYAVSETARDRDRLRREVLEKRGWRHHRIWSVEWYRDPDGETQRALAAWENAARHDKDRIITERSRITESRRPIAAGRGRCPIRVTGQGILGYTRSELVKLVRWIESDDVTRSPEEIIAEAMDVLGFQESSHRIQRALNGAIAQARDSVGTSD